MSLLQQSLIPGPTLASIIGSCPETLTEWESFKLSSKSKLLPVQMHMFWGVSMEPPIPVEGTGLGNERQGVEPMDVDVNEEEDLDDDIIEGCYFLEIGIEDFQLPRIWIRAEYVRIYNAIEDRHRTPYYPPLAPAVVITGQPGIGES